MASRGVPTFVERSKDGARIRAVLDGHAEAVRVGGAAYLVGFATEVFNRIRTRTPVDTGNARQGWRLQLRPGAAVILNRVRYVEVLEFGGYRGVGPKTQRGPGGIYSRQAPRGMVRRTLAEGNTIAKREARRLGFTIRPSPGAGAT
jgi:hypothetical protein